MDALRGVHADDDMKRQFINMNRELRRQRLNPGGELDGKRVRLQEQLWCLRTYAHAVRGELHCGFCGGVCQVDEGGEGCGLEIKEGL